MKTRALETEISVIRTYFQELWKTGKPKAKLFRTDSAGYLYDTGTNKILRCDSFEYSLLSNLLAMDIDKAIDRTLFETDKRQLMRTAQKIKKSIENENILKTNKPCKFSSADHFHKIEELINTKLNMILLEVTERCNLRCDYCIYNPRFPDKRNHGNRSMPISVAFASIDYLAEHNKTADSVAISFYGGEPLLRFSFIESCVNYAKKRILGKDVKFGITTNATLVTAQMGRYLYANNFNITVSLDGPEDIHNDYRKDKKGHGSFKRTLNGLRNLLFFFGEDSSRISINMVYAPPYSEHKLNRIAGLWESSTWLPKDIPATITYPDPRSIPVERTLYENINDISLREWAENRYMRSYKGEENPHPLSKSIVEKEAAVILRRPIHAEPKYEYNLNGCCIPGVRKIFVQTDGKYFLCERISKSPSIGNTFSGINIKKIKDIYISQYAEQSLPFCSDCWAIQLCHICYVHAFKDGKLDLERKNGHCSMSRFMAEANLRFFCKLLEVNPKGLSYLSNMVIT